MTTTANALPSTDALNAITAAYQSGLSSGDMSAVNQLIQQNQFTSSQLSQTNPTFDQSVLAGQGVQLYAPPSNVTAATTGSLPTSNANTGASTTNTGAAANTASTSTGALPNTTASTPSITDLLSQYNSQTQQGIKNAGLDTVMQQVNSGVNANDLLNSGLQIYQAGTYKDASGNTVTPASNTYVVSSPDGSGGALNYFFQVDPTTGKTVAINNPGQNLTYTPGSSGGFLNNVVSDFGSAINSLGPIGKIATVVAVNALLPGAGDLGAALTGADAASSTALTVGGAALGAANGGTLAALNGQNIEQGILTGALSGGVGANASSLATNVIGKDNLTSIANSLGGTFTPTQVSQIVGSAFTKSLVSAAASGDTSNVLSTFASNLVTSGLGTTASNQIYDAFDGQLNSKTLDSLAKAVGNATSATTAAAVSSGGNPNAIATALLTSASTSLGNYLGSSTASAVKSAIPSNTGAGATKVSDTGASTSGSVTNITTDPGSYSDAAPGTMTTMSNGEPGIVLDSGKIASLVDYRNAVASGQPFSIDGMMQTGSNATSLLKNAVSSPSTTPVDVSGTGAVVNAENASKLGFDTSQLPDGYQLVDAATSDAYYAAYGHNPPVTPLPDGTYVTMLPTSEIQDLNPSVTTTTQTGGVSNSTNPVTTTADDSTNPVTTTDDLTKANQYDANGNLIPANTTASGNVPNTSLQTVNVTGKQGSSDVTFQPVTVTGKNDNTDNTTTLNPVTVVGKNDNTDNTTTLNPVTVVGKNDNTDTNVSPVELNPVTVVSPRSIDPEPPVVQPPPPSPPPVKQPTLPVVPGTTITSPSTKTATTTTTPSVSQTSSSTTTGALPANLIGTMLASTAPAERAKLMQDLKQIYPELAHLDPKILSLLSGEVSGKQAESLMQSGVNMLQAPAASGSVPLSPISGSSGQTGLTPSTMTSPLMQGNYNALSSAGLQLMAGQQGALPSFKKGGTVEHIPQFVTGATGHYVKGEGDGQSDDIPAMLADGEYVFDADTVAALGNGSSDAGAEVLDKLREAIRKHKRSAPPDKIPPKAKSPLEYLKGVKL